MYRMPFVSRVRPSRWAMTVLQAVLCTVSTAWANEPSIGLHDGRVVTDGLPAVSADGRYVAATCLWAGYDGSGYLSFRVLSPGGNKPAASFDLWRQPGDDESPAQGDPKVMPERLRRAREILQRKRIEQSLVALGKGSSILLGNRRVLVWPLGAWLTLTYDERQGTLTVNARPPIRVARWRKRLSSHPAHARGRCCDGGIDPNARCRYNPEIEDVYFHAQSRVVLVRYGYALSAADGCEQPGGLRAFRLPRRFARLATAVPIDVAADRLGPLKATSRISLSSLRRLFVEYAVTRTGYSIEGERNTKYVVKLRGHPVLDVYPDIYDRTRRDALNRVWILSPLASTADNCAVGTALERISAAGSATPPQCFEGDEDWCVYLFCPCRSAPHLQLVFDADSKLPKSKRRARAVVWTPKSSP